MVDVTRDHSVKPFIYLDHAATAPIDPRVAAVVAAHWGDPLNASSVHRAGQRARARLEEARARIAALLGVHVDHVIFTSGATESNNLALRGWAAARPAAPVALSPLEHSCIRETVADLAARGALAPISLPVASDGRAALPPAGWDGLLCLMAVQNETGVVQDLDAARAWRLERPAARGWLCDIAQAIPALTAVDWRGADFLSLSAHKIGGPPGIGILAGPGVAGIAPQITGGPQEGEHRAGTQPVALALGMAEALHLAFEERAARIASLAALEDRLLAGLRARAVPFHLNGADAPRRAPGFLNISLPGRPAPDMVIALDMAGFCTSAGAACATGVMEPSPALRAMFPHNLDRAATALRITPGPTTDPAAIDQLAAEIARLMKSRP
jgi:cysteine desulfurase